MVETLEELEARHEQELEELEEKKQAHIDAARAVGKGKKAKAAIDEAEREAGTWEYEIRLRHTQEIDDLDGDAAGDNVGAASELCVARAAAPAVSNEDICTAESEAARIQQKKDKAAKKKQKQIAKEAGAKQNELPAQRSPSMGAQSPSMRGLRSPSQRWKDDPVAVEDMAPPTLPTKPEFEIIEGVQPFSETSQADLRMRELLEEVTLLSKDAFEEDALAMVTRKKGWKMTLLVHNGVVTSSTDAANEAVTSSTEAATSSTGDDKAPPPRKPLPFDGNNLFSLDAIDEAPVEPLLIAFIVYRIRPELSSFSIAKVAVVPEHRGKGHGGHLMDWAKAQAKKQKEINYISLSSLPAAVRFYNKIGFKAVDVQALRDDCGDNEELVEGQVYMEFQVRKGGRKKR